MGTSISHPTRKTLLAKHLFFVVLALISGVFIIIEFLYPLTESQIALIDITDDVIALIFLADFCLRLFFAKRKKNFMRTYWWELLACIPLTTPITQALRLVRLLSIVRIMRLVAHEEGVREARPIR